MLKIISAEQIRQADEYTISHEPVTSIDLMERAAAACFSWITKQCDLSKTFLIFCGDGNNGGDGLAIARMLQEAKMKVKVYVLKSDKQSADYSTNLNRLRFLSVAADEISTENNLPEITTQCIVVDALFGIGL